jgi:hypothetical protein
VRRASKIVGKGTGTPEETEEARAILSNYRMAHAFPLNAVTVTVRKRALEVHPDAVVAQRHKRLPTILDKLERHPSMSVTTMQDLGGCRVVYESVAEVDRLVDSLRVLARSRNKVKRVYDYLRDDPGPRESGYAASTWSTPMGRRSPSTTGSRSNCKCGRNCSMPGPPRWRRWTCSRAAS